MLYHALFMFVIKNMEQKEKVAAYALSRVLMYEPIVARRIIEQFGSAYAFMGLGSNGIRDALGPYNKYSAAFEGVDLGAYEKELDDINARGSRYITMLDEGFPPLLNECVDGPVGLFVQSDSADEEIFFNENIAVVGTRDISPYGREWTKRIVQSLGSTAEQPTIVSGLAYGVDITAHCEALECGLKTIAVLGTGIHNIYPSSHQKHADRICSTKGCAVVSEFPPCVDVTGVNFLSRNRVIAGMSRVTVLVESRIKGGGMSTARDANSYNREVFALPGRNDDSRSQGCNLLIYSHIAGALIGCDEFLKSLGYRRSPSKKKSGMTSVAAQYYGTMDAVNIKTFDALMKLIRKERGIRIDELADRMGLEYKEASTMLHRMESDGFIDIDLLQQCSERRNPQLF